MATDAQIEANRLNATRSSGPRTPEGKVSSRRNSLKLGLTGKGIVLPEAEAQAVADRVAKWGPGYRLVTDEDHWVMRQLALETVRLDRCHQEDRALRIQRADRAELCWDEDRTHEAHELFAKIAKRPELVSRQLQRTPHGCDVLIERWNALAAVLKPGTPWDDECRALAKDLLGIPIPLREVPSEIDPISGEDAVALQQSLAREEAARLAAWKTDALDALDASERDHVILGLAAPDRDQWRLLRYEFACFRRYQIALRRLQKPRMSAAAMPVPQAAPAFEFAADPEGFRLVAEPEPADPFAEPVDENISTLETLVARLETLGLETGSASAAPCEATEPAAAEEVPAPIAKAIETPGAGTIRGNRRHRKAMLHRARKLAK